MRATRVLNVGRRVGVVVAVVACFGGAGLALAACSGGGSPGVASLGSTTTTTTVSSAATGGFFVGIQQRYKDDLAFASCMQTNGVAGFPDPVMSSNSSGRGGLSFNQGFDANSHAYKLAFATCKHDLPNNGGPPTAAQLAAIGAQLLKFAQCMRDHGLPSFPDPTINSHQIGFEGIDPTSAAFKTAQSSCKAFQLGS